MALAKHQGGFNLILLAEHQGWDSCHQESLKLMSVRSSPACCTGFVILEIKTWHNTVYLPYLNSWQDGSRIDIVVALAKHQGGFDLILRAEHQGWGSCHQESLKLMCRTSTRSRRQFYASPPSSRSLAPSAAPAAF